MQRHCLTKPKDGGHATPTAFTKAHTNNPNNENQNTPIYFNKAEPRCMHMVMKERQQKIPKWRKRNEGKNVNHRREEGKEKRRR